MEGLLGSVLDLDQCGPGSEQGREREARVTGVGWNLASVPSRASHICTWAQGLPESSSSTNSL